MWVPHGKTADQTKWRFDVAQKMFVPPGEKSGPKGTQVEMPLNYRGNEPRDFHMVASPAGSQAPIDHINYTPETGEVHGRGQAAPPHMLNYTLLPGDALGAGHGSATGGIAQGMGAGAGAPALSAFGAPQAFAGTPPLAGSPNMMGADPGSARAMPQWGGGGTPFGSRMGMGNMGAGDDPTDVDPTKPPPGATTGPAQPAPAPAQAAPPAEGGTTASGLPIAPGYPQGVPKGTPQKPDGSYYQVNEAVPVYGQMGVIGYQIFQGVDEFRKPQWRYDSGQANASEKDRYQSYNNNDGTVTIVDFSKKPPEVSIRGVADPGIAAKAAADAEKAKTEAEIKKLELQAQQATTDTARQEAIVKLQTAQAQLKIAQANVDKANIEAGMAGKPKVGEKAAEIVTRTGEVYALNPDTNQYEPTGAFKQAGTWKEYTDPTTQTVRLYNPDTEEDVELHPVDKYKEYPPQKAGAGKWIQWDPGAQTYKTIYQEDPDYETQWAGNELIAINKNDKTAPPKVIWTKKTTPEEDDAHTAAIDLHNKTMLEMLKTREELMSPKASFSGGMMYVPQGLDVTTESFDPFTKATSTHVVSGGPRDPRTVQAMQKIDEWLASGGQTPAPKAAAGAPTAQTQNGGDQTQTQKTAGGSDTQERQGGGDQPTAGEQMGGRDIRPGYPGWDPEHVNPQPPTTRTTAAGDIASYDENGNLTGIRYINTAPPGYEELGLDTGESAYEELGGGNERKRMGAGMASVGTGGTGWAPQGAPRIPAQGVGFVGAGAEDTYDADGNPTYGAGQVMPMVTPPKLPTGGHTPGPEIKLPNITDKGVDFAPKLPGGHVQGPEIKLPTETDKGVNWIPGLKDLVTARVHESLKELLGWPKIETMPPEPEGEGLFGIHGLQGGHDQPDVDLVNLENKKEYPQTEPASDIGRPPNIKDLAHLLGEGGTGPEDWEEIEGAEGMGRGAGRGPIDPEAKAELERYRRERETLGTGQEPGMMPPSGGAGPQIPPQGPGGEQPPAWLLTLLRTHPELLEMAGLRGPAAGGAPPPPQPPTAAAGAPTPPGQPAGGIPTPPSAAPPGPSAGWAPPSGGGPPSGVPGGLEVGPGGGGALPPGAPVAPSPEGAPMTPPLPPEDVAGIGHRFGQPMEVGEPQHSGVDLQAPEGTPTKSPVDGFVLRVEDNPQGLGTTVVIKGMDGSEHRLGHLKSTTAYAGMQVKMGQDLGSPVGETGMTTGAHLHWGVKDGQGQPADPTQALGPMKNMPPVPGTEMMGPPGGVGGGAQMGGGQDEGMPPSPGQMPLAMPPGAPPPGVEQAPPIGASLGQFLQPKKEGAGNMGAGATPEEAYAQSRYQVGQQFPGQEQQAAQAYQDAQGNWMMPNPYGGPDIPYLPGPVGPPMPYYNPGDPYTPIYPTPPNIPWEPIGGEPRFGIEPPWMNPREPRYTFPVEPGGGEPPRWSIEPPNMTYPVQPGGDEQLPPDFGGRKPMPTFPRDQFIPWEPQPYPQPQPIEFDPYREAYLRRLRQSMADEQARAAQQLDPGYQYQQRLQREREESDRALAAGLANQQPVQQPLPAPAAPAAPSVGESIATNLQPAAAPKPQAAPALQSQAQQTRQQQQPQPTQQKQQQAPAATPQEQSMSGTLGGGQESRRKGKRKAGWKPRYGAGQMPPQGAQGQPPQMAMLQQLLQQYWQQMTQGAGPPGMPPQGAPQPMGRGR